MKTLQKKTYALPSDVVEEFEKHVAPGKRGKVLGEIVRAYLAEKKREELWQRIEEGFADEENQALYLEVEREWSPLSDEVWAQLPEEDDWPEPLITFPEGYAAYEAEQRAKYGR